MIQTYEKNSDYNQNKNLQGLLDMDQKLAEIKLKSEIQSAEQTIQKLKDQGAKLKIQVEELTNELGRKQQLAQEKVKVNKMDPAEENQLLQSLEKELINVEKQKQFYQREYDQVIQNKLKDQRKGGIVARLQATEEQIKKLDTDIEQTQKENNKKKEEIHRLQKEINNVKSHTGKTKVQSLNNMKDQLLLMCDKLGQLQETYEKNEQTHSQKLDLLNDIKQQLRNFLQIEEKQWPVVKDIFDVEQVREHRMQIQAQSDAIRNQEILGRHSSVDQQSAMISKLDRLIPLSVQSADQEGAANGKYLKEKWKLNTKSVKQSRNTDDNYDKKEENLDNFIELLGDRKMLEDAKQNLDKIHEKMIEDYQEQKQQFQEIREVLDRDLQTKAKEKEMAENIASEMRKHVRYNALKPLEDNRKMDSYDILLLCDSRNTKRVVQGQQPNDFILHCEDIDLIGRDQQSFKIQKIIFYYREEDQKIIGSQITYKVGEFLVVGREHVNLIMKNKSQKVTFELEDDDPIQKVYGSIRENIEYLYFRTSKNKIFEIGAQRPKSLEFKFEFQQKELPVLMFLGLDLTAESSSPNELLIVYIGFEIQNQILDLERLPFNQLKNQLQKNISQLPNNSSMLHPPAEEAQNKELSKSLLIQNNENNGEESNQNKQPQIENNSAFLSTIKQETNMDNEIQKTNQNKEKQKQQQQQQQQQPQVHETDIQKQQINLNNADVKQFNQTNSVITDPQNAKNQVIIDQQQQINEQNDQQKDGVEKDQNSNENSNITDNEATQNKQKQIKPQQKDAASGEQDQQEVENLQQIVADSVQTSLENINQIESTKENQEVTNQKEAFSETENSKNQVQIQIQNPSQDLNSTKQQEGFGKTNEEISKQINISEKEQGAIEEENQFDASMPKKQQKQKQKKQVEETNLDEGD